MKSIEDTLKLVDNIVAQLRKAIDIKIALVGGIAAIAHGSGRTTVDVDFLVYSGCIKENVSQFIDLFRDAAPAHFELKWVTGGKMIDDPFPYDILFLTDTSGQFPKLDFIIPRYKWELEGLDKAAPLKDLHFPIIPMPYLIAMKLRAGGPRDHADVLELYHFLSDEEKERTERLATLIKRDKSLKRLLNPEKTQTNEPDDDSLLI